MAKKKDSILQPANKKGRHVNGVLIGLRIFILPIVWLMFPFRFIGKRKVKDGACIYISNHYRIWDVAYPACTTSEGIHYVAKSNLNHGIVGAFCHKVKVLFVDRDGKDLHQLMDMMKCLKNNEKLCIFPEGTRNKTEEEILPFKSGASMLAIKTKTPVVPICLYKKPMPFRMNHILIGEPFELSEYYGVKLTQEVINEADEKLKQRLLEMREEHRKALEAKKRK